MPAQVAISLLLAASVAPVTSVLGHIGGSASCAVGAGTLKEAVLFPRSAFCTLVARVLVVGLALSANFAVPGSFHF